MSTNVIIAGTNDSSMRLTKYMVPLVRLSYRPQPAGVLACRR